MAVVVHAVHGSKMKITGAVLLLVGAYIIGNAQCFSAVPKTTERSRRTRAFVSMSNPPEEAPTQEQSSNPSTERHQTPSSPAVVFGKPLNDDEKRRNKQLIGMAKSALFDVLLPGDTVDRAYARFYALETIARMPYFSYLSVLHLYETLGWWRRSDYIKMHFAESWNELHHLLIMEELGGSDRWFDRFIAQHCAFFYYWVVVACYMTNPSFAYNLNQAVEEHAYDTYSNFIVKYEEYLKTLPAPDIAKAYYRDGDLYMFDEMHTSVEPVRRPKCDTLYDVFVAIKEDEWEHVKTMEFLQHEDADLCGPHDDTCVAEQRSATVGVKGTPATETA